MSGSDELAFPDAGGLEHKPTTLAEMIETMSDQVVGQTWIECRQRLFNHYWRIKKSKLFPDKDLLTDSEKWKVENAVEAQLVLSNNVVLYMVWKRVGKVMQAHLGLPVKQKDFCASIGITGATVRGWRKTYNWLESYLLMSSLAGNDLMQAVKNAQYVEIIENSMDRSNGKQHHWMNMSLEIRGDKKPQKAIQVNIDFDNLTEDQIDRIAAGEPIEKVVAK